MGHREVSALNYERRGIVYQLPSYHFRSSRGIFNTAAYGRGKRGRRDVSVGERLILRFHFTSPRVKVPKEHVEVARVVSNLLL